MNIAWQVTIPKLSSIVSRVKFCKKSLVQKIMRIVVAPLIPLKFTGSNSFFNFKKKNDRKAD